MKRRGTLLALVALGLAPLARAQQVGSIPRLGFLSPVSPDPRRDAFLQGLRELGYVDGQNVRIEMRFADGRPSRSRGRCSRAPTG